ncbi:Tn7 transposase TnsA N-terminal domain-containing protein [Aneurinibacillus uraniidurans]|uniref:Tn7 transposase TnsA N-terminal domain-containing protein n=1 Tax=Aneurinibacillus uraniidurans TaxID=2966586 RepID=UPI002349AC7A|nr:Tn7 transposase TnsA N-terminal domain-containing protein [Aneurinibacillus sp. B1]WCN36215.1 Tn7 transposase TnsA N-terminal domain-containing protein [Aneurinibacillus sp. B1]
MLIETNPDIVSFCEQPLKVQEEIDGKIYETIFDMWIKRKDGTEEFIEVKYSKDVESDRNERVQRQLFIQKVWCAKNGYKHNIQTEKHIRGNPIYLANMKLIIPYLKQYPNLIETDKYKIMKALQNGCRTIKDIEDYSNSKTILESIIHLFYEGLLLANLHKHPLTVHTKVWLNE